MSQQTAIEWCDATWNPVVGCTKVSQGCKNCYAKQLHDQRHKALLAGKTGLAPQYAQPFEVVQLMPSRLDEPLRWRRARRVFVNSVSDLFHEEVPDYFLAQVFAVMACAPRHTFQVLTKRPKRMLELLTDEQFYGDVYAFIEGTIDRYVDPNNRRRGDMRAVADCPDPAHPLPNVWLGVSVENQATANERIELLLRTPAAIRFLSCEPLLGPIDFPSIPIGDPLGECDECGGRATDCEVCSERPRLDWIIVGGESGSKARDCNVEWIEAIVCDCDLAGVPCFVKQLGARPVIRNDVRDDEWPGASLPLLEGYEPQYQGEIAPLEMRDAKGGDPDEWPERLRVRQFPGDALDVDEETLRVTAV